MLVAIHIIFIRLNKNKETIVLTRNPTIMLLGICQIDLKTALIQKSAHEAQENMLNIISH